MGLKQESCDHKFRFSLIDQYVKESGRYTNTYYQAKIFHCEKCLLEKKVEKTYHGGIYELDSAPEWVQSMIINSKK